MSDTAHILSQLSEYLDNALAAKEKRVIEKHLEQCKDCSARCKELEHLRQRLKAVPELTPPESFYQGVLQRIEEDKKPFLIWDWPMTTKAVATFGVLMVVVMVAREARRSEPELFAPVSQPTIPEATPAVPVSAPQPVANTAPVQVPVVVHAQPQTQSIVSTNGPVALKQKTSSRAIVASNSIGADEEREKNTPVDQLKSAAQARANAGMADKTLSLAGTEGSSLGTPMVAGKVTLQARDIKGPATQSSFAEGQQQPLAKKEALAAEWKGDSSAISSFKTVVITNDADWKALWTEHAQNQVPPPPVPDVDFNRFIVVGVFAGTRQDLQGIVIQDIQTASDSSTVLYKEVPLAPTMGLAAATNRPYHLKRISKSALPITFTKQP